MGKIVKLQPDKKKVYDGILNRKPVHERVCSISKNRKEKLRKNIIKNTKSF